ncbi:bifunctional sugar phosphate isomerase/epimerase/4-hydroxyphenylpyruvate dioxygenase family protein [Bartonella sp. LJL80]
MKTSIATVSIAGTLPEKLEAIAKAGFDGVEIFENDFLTYDATPLQVGQMVRDYGLAITLFQPFRDFEGMPEPYRGRAFERAQKKFDVMNRLGADMVLVCSNLSSVCLAGVERAAEDFHQLGELARQHGIKVGYEALAWGKHVYDHRDAWAIVQKADHPNVGLILDSFHTLARGIDVASILDIPKEKLFFVQLADAPLIDMDLLFWSRHFRNMPGEGGLPVKDFMAAVAETGYDGYFSLEIFNDRFRGGSPYAIAHDGQRSLINLADTVRRTRNVGSLTLNEMPAPIDVHGIGFIEFSTDETEEAALLALLGQMGFKLTGRHKTKNVDLLTQGTIKLIINRDKGGFSNLSFALHGTMAYAIALNVDDTAAALKRAVALGAVEFEQAAIEGQAYIPAVRSVGGGVIYFLDGKTHTNTFDQTDFDPIESDGVKLPMDAGLLQFDHIGQSVDFDEMMTWLLFYNTLFNTRKTPLVDIVDPAGIIRSQVIENSAGSLRITMNGADNRHTLAGHFIADKHGSGIQHIAFKTEDIFKTAQALRANGFKTLRISANYYDDIEARFGLEQIFCDRLKQENILYDRDETGEYYQLYSETYGEGFFFEIVQRDGYGGYGAPNAIFRIAAQKKQIRQKGMPKH